MVPLGPRKGDIASYLNLDLKLIKNPIFESPISRIKLDWLNVNLVLILDHF